MATYYVAPNGDNSNPGTAARPWRTISFATRQVRAGDEILVADGTYQEQVELTDELVNSGTAVNPIKLTANGDNVRVTNGGTNNPQTGVQTAIFRLKNVSGWEITGFRIENESRCAFSTWTDTTMDWIVIRNNYLYKVVPYDSSGTKTTSPMRLTAGKGDGGLLTRLWVVGNTLVECNPRNTFDGRGTENITVMGNVQHFLVEDNRITNCVEIGIDILGAITGTDRFVWGNPSWGVVRNNIVEGQTIARYGTSNGYYADRQGHNNLWENNVMWSPTRSIQFTVGWEVGSLDIDDTDNIIVRNNLTVSNRNSMQVGTGSGFAEGEKIRRVRLAHNVNISTGSSGSAMRARYAGGSVALKNNVWEQKNLDGAIFERQYDNALDWSASCNQFWAQGSNKGTLKWSSTRLSPSNYAESIEAGTGINASPQYRSEGNYSANTFDTSWDYSLSSGSAGYDSACALTTVTAAVNGGTTLQVGDAGWFYPGNNMPTVLGDPILVDDQPCQVVAVDYSTNVIRVDRPITASVGAEIRYNSSIQSRGLLGVVLSKGVPDQRSLMANAGIDQTITDWDDDGNQVVALDGSRSTATGTIVSWQWSSDTGVTIPDGQTTGAVFPIGTHIVSLTVTDNDGVSASDSVVILVLAPASSDRNLLTNGSFADGDTGWNWFTAGSAALAVVDGEAVVNVTDDGGNTLLYQADLTLAAGEEYTISFNLRSDSGPAPLVVSMLMNTDPYSNLGLNESALAEPEEKRVEYRFTATESVSNARLQFAFESSAQNIYLDDVRLLAIDEGEEPRFVRLIRLGVQSGSGIGVLG